MLRGVGARRRLRGLHGRSQPGGRACSCASAASKACTACMGDPLAPLTSAEALFGRRTRIPSAAASACQRSPAVHAALAGACSPGSAGTVTTCAGCCTRTRTCPPPMARPCCSSASCAGEGGAAMAGRVGPLDDWGCVGEQGPRLCSSCAAHLGWSQYHCHASPLLPSTHPTHASTSAAASSAALP